MFFLSRERTVAFVVVASALYFLTVFIPVFNPDPRRRDSDRWTLHCKGDASASLVDVSNSALTIQVDRATKGDFWSVRVARMLEIGAGERCDVAFRATSPVIRRGQILLRQGQPGGQNITDVETFDVSPDGHEVRLSWEIKADEPDARIEFLLGDQEGSVHFEAISIRLAID